MGPCDTTFFLISSQFIITCPSPTPPPAPLILPLFLPMLCTLATLLLPLFLPMLCDPPCSSRRVPTDAPRARPADRVVAPAPLPAPRDDAIGVRRSTGPWRGSHLASPPATASRCRWRRRPHQDMMHVSNVHLKCFICFRDMFQLFSHGCGKS